MPVEIKELIIRVSTTSESQDAEALSQSQGPVDERAAIIQECVKQVLKILKKRMDR